VPYCIDSSSVIDAGERHYPIDVFPGFWDRLDAMIGDGMLKAPETLITELEEKDDTWRNWVYDRKHAMILKIDEPIQQAMGNVMNVYAANASNLNSVKGDPWFVASSLVYGFTLITSEKPKKGGVKIPKVCDELGVKWC
jgi:hypothetical protein